jgi:hypothetical protein
MLTCSAWRRLTAKTTPNYAGTGQISHQGRQVEALNLPRAALEKFYHQNAERVFRLKAAWERK